MGTCDDGTMYLHMSSIVSKLQSTLIYHKGLKRDEIQIENGIDWNDKQTGNPVHCS